MENKEIWKDIKGYEGLYAVSTFGNVKSYNRTAKSRFGNRLIKGKILKSEIVNGYKTVQLYDKNKRKLYKRIHKLVADAFLPKTNKNPDGREIIGILQVNHKNENKLDNNINNLEWCDTKYNNNYGSRTERAKNKMSRKIICNETKEIFNCENDAARKYNNRHISDVLSGKRKSAGFIIKNNIKIKLTWSFYND